MKKLYHKILRFILKHQLLYKTIGATEWFKHEVAKEARWIINHLGHE